MFAPVPALRVNRVNDMPIRESGSYVLYWMIACRRTRWSYALQHAMSRAAALGKPLIVLEALRVGYRWASPRIHRFVMDGMRDHAARFAGTPIAYHAYVEPEVDHGKGLLEALAEPAACVVTDEFPDFFLPKMVAAAGRRLNVALEQVDGNGLLPLRAADKTFIAANHFRRFLQRELPRYLDAAPVEDPLARAHELPAASVPRAVLERWPMPSAAALDGSDSSFLAGLPIDHAVPVVAYGGGEVAGRAALDAFLRKKLSLYAEARNEPEQDVSSGLSPYLHFGHTSVHEVMHRVWRREGWTSDKVAPKPTGSREGWWGLSPEAEAFVDELVTWREIGYNFSFLRPDDHDRWESLPEWAKKTLDKHTSDDRPVLYDRRQLEAGRTYDALWNAAQRQLVVEGRIHNYLRMLWAKKILEWSETPRDALATLIELNNRWAVDGRDPNSYSGIFWCFGRFDRPWPPERQIFGTIRYMSSDNTARKVSVKRYIARWSGPGLL
ncbi:MAG: deoxyribodipyrimidine photolyase [Myxococcota bacterium]